MAHGFDALALPELTPNFAFESRLAGLGPRVENLERRHVGIDWSEESCCAGTFYSTMERSTYGYDREVVNVQLHVPEPFMLIALYAEAYIANNTDTIYNLDLAIESNVWPGTPQQFWKDSFRRPKYGLWEKAATGAEAPFATNVSSAWPNGRWWMFHAPFAGDLSFTMVSRQIDVNRNGPTYLFGRKMYAIRL